MLNTYYHKVDYIIDFYTVEKENTDSSRKYKPV